MNKLLLSVFAFCSFMILSVWAVSSEKVYVFEVKEIELTAELEYSNPYKEAECWIELQGPGFNKKIYGFWDGGNRFVVRVAATTPGQWHWKSFSNPGDPGLSGKFGSFTAIAWREKEKEINPNRRGYVKPSNNGHALVHADGKPFFMLGDTWWASSTWHYPLKGITPAENYVPKEGISFEEAVSFRKRQGYNTIAMIACFPNWKVDTFPNEYINQDKIGVRQAWEKWMTPTAKDMQNENGNIP